MSCPPFVPGIEAKPAPAFDCDCAWLLTRTTMLARTMNNRTENLCIAPPLQSHIAAAGDARCCAGQPNTPAAAPLQRMCRMILGVSYYRHRPTDNKMLNRLCV